VRPPRCLNAADRFRPWIAARRLPERGRRAALGVLILLTSAAVGSAVSWWLVPVYLGLMGWLLTGAREVPPAGRESAVPELPEPPSPVAEAQPAIPAREEAPPSAESKGKRKQGSRKRSRKPKAIADLPVTAQWVRVGPGRFVRAEGPPALDAEAPPEIDTEGLPAEATEDPPACPDPDPSHAALDAGAEPTSVQPASIVNEAAEHDPEPTAGLALPEIPAREGIPRRQREKPRGGFVPRIQTSRSGHARRRLTTPRARARLARGRGRRMSSQRSRR
jgi:hypothetical protein